MNNMLLKGWNGMKRGAGVFSKISACYIAVAGFIAAARFAAEHFDTATNITIVPEPILAMTHPGLYMKQTRVISSFEFRFNLLYKYTERASSVYSSFTSIPSIDKSTYQEASQCYEIDQGYLECEPQDRTFHENAWRWAADNILKDGRKPLKDYTRVELFTTLATLHDKLSEPSLYKYLSSMMTALTMRSPLRTQQMIVWQDQNLMTDPYKLALNEAYFKKKSKTELNNFKHFYNTFYYAFIGSSEDSKFINLYDVYVNVLQSSNEHARAFMRQYVGLPTDVRHLQREVNKFLDNLPGIINTDPIKAAAYAHCKIGELHPFGHETGRLARMMMNCILKQNGHQAVFFLKNKDYMAATNKAIQSQNYGIFEEFLRDKIKQQLEGKQSFWALSEAMTNCQTGCQATLDAKLKR